MTKEEQAAHQKYIRSLRKKYGLCVRCGKEPAREGKTNCQPCAEKNSQKSLAYYYRKKGEQNDRHE